MKYCKKCLMPDTRPGIKFNEQIVCSACINFDKRKTKKEEYFLKKDDAEKIYDSFSSKKEEVVDRIRGLPLIGDKVHLEPENKSLYYEAISNFWFGNFNASICMLSIFVESFLKEIWYYKHKKHYDNDLDNLINDCYFQKFILIQYILQIFTETNLE